MTQNTVKRSQLEGHRMIDGNEYIYPTVIDNGVLKQWTAIGWMDMGPPSQADIEKYPTVVEDDA